MANPELKTLSQEDSLEKSIDKLTNFDAEIAVIGCLLWDNKSYEKFADFLSEEHFSDQNNLYNLNLSFEFSYCLKRVLSGANTYNTCTFSQFRC